MDRISGIKKLTDNRYLNLYELDATFRDGSKAPYYVASRRPNSESLKAVTGDNRADGVLIYGVHGPQRDKVVLIRQYRYPVNAYVYEFPAGLVEALENPAQAAAREFFEETGLTLSPINGGAYQRPFFTTVGMTDESCATVFGYCNGTPSSAHQEGSEDIEVFLADREECRRILKEERVAIMCAYMLMHFIATEGDPFTFLQK